MASKTIEFRKTTNESLTLTYKTSGDLATATAPSGAEFTYEYDAFGNRTAEAQDGNLKAAYLYAPGISGPVAKVNSSGQEEARFIYATRSHVPDFMVAGSNTYRLVTDQLGSARFVVNASTGHVVQEITYDPFGEVTSDSNPGFQPFGYAGGLYEPETGLTHFGAREYDAELGRWTSSDPIGFSGGDTNLYGYVIQDPVNLIDPSGLIGVVAPGQTPVVSPHEVAAAAGGTIGWCAGIDAAWGGSLDSDVCISVSQNGDVGVTVSSDYGVGSPGIGAATGPLFSNAKCLEELLGKGYGSNTSVGVGPYDIGIEGEWSSESGRDVWSLSPQWTPSFSPYPASGGLSVNETIAAASLKSGCGCE